jgi:hypothetical protein
MDVARREDSTAGQLGALVPCRAHGFDEHEQEDEKPGRDDCH